MQSCERETCLENIFFLLSSGWPKIASTNFLWMVLFELEYNIHLVIIHFLRWIASPSSFRVTESCTGRPQDYLPLDPGRCRKWRSLLSAALSSLHSRRALCMRSRSGLISMSFKAWTVNPEQRGRLKKVWRKNAEYFYIILGAIQQCVHTCGMTHDPVGSFHVGFCHSITGSTAPLFKTQDYWGCMWMHVCVSACLCLSVWPSCCAFFVYDWWCYCQTSSNPSPSSHRPELWLETTHTSFCEDDLSPKAWYIQALTRPQSSMAQYHTQTHTQVCVWMNSLFRPMPKQKCIQQHCTRPASSLESNNWI